MIEHTNGVSGKIILDSVSPEGIRLTTLHMRYPRMVHAELMTHRVFSRNGRSSRAVPVMTILNEGHYTPHFMKNKPGMVATEEFDEETLRYAQQVWNELAALTKDHVAELARIGVHKQWANRPLEAFGYIDVLITSTDWANFMALRDEGGAQPEIKSIAELIKQLMGESTPKTLNPGDWHMPYINYEEDFLKVKNELVHVNPEDVDEALLKISVARCARLSIKPFDGDASIEKELKRYKLLMESRPVHASPAEHIATPDSLYSAGRTPNMGGILWNNPSQHGNFYGWRQFRKMIKDNTVKDR
jgi:hypothetical protein